jgi:hypothetical protein
MKPHPQSKYSNDNPPYKDKKWVYNDARNTVVGNTFTKHGLPYKVAKIIRF